MHLRSLPCLLALCLAAQLYGCSKRPAVMKQESNASPPALSKEDTIRNDVFRGNISAVQSYLRAGGDPNLPRADGTTLLLIATSFGHVQLARMLVERGADVNAKDVAGGSASRYAVQGFKVEGVDIVKFLIDKGAHVNDTDIKGRSPLMIAAWSGSTEIVKLLLSKGSKINKADIDGYTPLMRAASTGRYDTVKVLLEHGANVNAQTNFDTRAKRTWNAKEIARIRNRNAISALLEKSGNAKHSR